MPRLFVALHLPEMMIAALQPLCTGLPGVRWSLPRQMHLTLRFIGEVDEQRSQQVRATLQMIHGIPFDLQLQGVGQFPPRGRPRVLWVGVQAPPALFQLQSDINRTIIEAGCPSEDRPFAAHITLARLKIPPDAAALRAYFERHQTFRTPTFTAREFILYSSQLTPAGSIYQPEAVYPLPV